MIYFDQCSTSFPKAPGAVDAMRDVLENGCFNINRGGYAGSYGISELVFEAREKIAALFDCPSGRQVVFTGGITQSLNMVLKGLLRPGDHVVTTQMEHNSVVRPLAQLQGQGVRVDVVQCGHDGTLDLSDIEAKITGQTKLVVMCHASNVCGAILPIREVGAMCRRKGVLLAVDSAQTAGTISISMQNDFVDIIAFTAHKGLLAAPGVGGIVLPQEVADKMVPLIAGGTGSHSHAADMPAELPDRLEAGTLNLPGILALSAALDYIAAIGADVIYKRQMELLARMTDGLKSIAGVRIVGPENILGKCAIAALDFTSHDSAVVASRLDEEYGIMTRCGLHCAPEAHRALGTFPRGLLRCSLGHQNTDMQVDVFLSALGKIIKGA